MSAADSTYAVIYPAGRRVNPDVVWERPLLSTILRPGAFVYRTVSSRLRAARLARRSEMDPLRTVVSVGNLEIGGNGKTPFAIQLMDHLAGRGLSPVYVSRGFKGKAERRGVVTVVLPRSAHPMPELPTGTNWLRRDSDRLCEEIGDEGAMVALRCPDVPLVISRHRDRAIRLASQVFEVTHIVLDDAFQTWRVGRDIDLVLLDARHPFGNGRLIPAGTLREEPAALRRANAVGVNGVSDPSELASVADRVRPHCAPGTPIFGVRRRLTLPPEEGGETGQPIAAVSGIARPARFERALSELTGTLRCAFRFPDHHPYREPDLVAIAAEVRRRGIQTVVTTEKDWVKLSRFPEAGARVLVARLELELVGTQLSDLVP